MQIVNQRRRKMKLNDTDIGIRITQEGESELFIPKIDNLSGESIRAVLKEIRKLELMFTELANETYDDTENGRNTSK